MKPTSDALLSILGPPNSRVWFADGSDFTVHAGPRVREFVGAIIPALVQEIEGRVAARSGPRITVSNSLGLDVPGVIALAAGFPDDRNGWRLIACSGVGTEAVKAVKGELERLAAGRN